MTTLVDFDAHLCEEHASRARELCLQWLNGVRKVHGLDPYDPRPGVWK